jgi:hypothetical protein
MITSKECLICHKTKKVSNYYIHRDNKPGHGTDFTCKECNKKIVTNLEGLKKYCDLNSRHFVQDLYDLAHKTSTEKYVNDVEFNSLSEEKRESFLFEKVKNIYFSRMGGTQYYSYLNTNEGQYNEEIMEDNLEAIKEDSEPIKKEKKIYSSEWQGTYSRSQLDYLESYYFDTTNDFVITTRSHKDYVKKIAKASLAMDEAFDDMMQGTTGADKRYKENKTIFDSLSQSAKLSEKTRGQNDVAGLGSLSEIVMKLEQTGFLQKKIEFEDDAISKINKDLRHILSSMD